MTTSKKLQSTLANAGGAGLNVEDVFSTYLYTGNGSTQTITNGIDLAGEGGLVWCKGRNISSDGNNLIDSARGLNKLLITNGSDAQYTRSGGNILTFLSSGFTFELNYNGENASGANEVAWTFRKAPKFFDVVTYTGNGATTQNIAHNLGVRPGFIIIKPYSATGDWSAMARADATKFYSNLKLNTTAAGTLGTWSETGTYPVNDTVFPTYIGPTSGLTNTNGVQYVAYLFAHNDGDGEFGESGDQDIIKCGSYTGTGSDGNSISLGFEPQWVLVKKTNEAYNWTIFDNMRGVVNGGNDQFLYPNLADAESSITNAMHFDADGFTVNGGFAWTNDNNDTYIYIAIRRPMKTPESGTEVFDPNYTTSNQFVTTGFPVDLQIGQYTGGGSPYWVDRLRGMSTSTTGAMRYLTSSNNNAETSNTGSLGFNGFVQNGFSHTLGNFAQRLFSFKRAPGFFDVVAYTGNGTAGRTVNHNLGVTPELMIVKRRVNTANWVVYHASIGATQYSDLNQSNAFAASSGYWDDTAPTDAVFTVGSFGNVNLSGAPLIAYLFASLDGISKVGSYTGNGGGQTIDCGFSTGARFVLIKRADASGDWHTFDTERGIVAGNDPRLELNTTNAEDTSADYIDPVSSGFAVTSSSEVNASGGNYIFYAIA
jgi:hypothetical protein